MSTQQHKINPFDGPELPKESPFKVPDSYFEDFGARMMAVLPEYPKAPAVVEMSRWQRIKPYLYLAAMFAGIWCMMKVFHTVSSDTYSLDNPPEAVVVALNNEDNYEFFSGDYLSSSDVSSDYEIPADVSSSYSDMDEFEEAFGYDLKPGYEDIEISLE